MAGEKSKILIFGGTGYLGKFMVKTSVSLGHPTYAYVRPIKTATDSSKLQLHKEFKAMGVTLFQVINMHACITYPSYHGLSFKIIFIDNSSKLQLHKEFKAMGVTLFQGELDEHEKLVWALRQVDIVISTLPVPRYLEQLKIIKAIKDAGNIKRFLPSEFGVDDDRVSGLQPFEAIHVQRRKIRRATEAAGIPYTYVSANCFASYFVDYLLHPGEKREEVIVYGSGEAKAVLNYEEDVAAYTVRAATDPRAANKIVICRPEGNIVSQLELISLWEKKAGRNLKKTHIPEQKIIEMSKTLPHPDNVSVSILHSLFIKGDTMNFELTDNDLEATKLFPDYKYTSIDNVLDICLVDPPKIKLIKL